MGDGECTPKWTNPTATNGAQWEAFNVWFEKKIVFRHWGIDPMQFCLCVISILCLSTQTIAQVGTV